MFAALLLPFILPTVAQINHHPAHPNTATEQKLDKFWQRAESEVYKSHEEIFSQRLREYRRGDFLPALVAGDSRQKTIALTFDDGPHPDVTPNCWRS